MTRDKMLAGYIIRNMGGPVEVHQGGELLFVAESVPEAIERIDRERAGQPYTGQGGVMIRCPGCAHDDCECLA